MESHVLVFTHQHADNEDALAQGLKRCVCSELHGNDVSCRYSSLSFDAASSEQSIMFIRARHGADDDGN